jgi:hypothetical protein
MVRLVLACAPNDDVEMAKTIRPLTVLNVYRMRCSFSRHTGWLRIDKMGSPLRLKQIVNLLLENLIRPLR